MSAQPTQELLLDRWRRDPLFKLGVVLVAAVLVAAAAAPWLAPHDPLLGDLANDSLAPPGSATRGRILARRNPQAPTAASPRGRGHRPRRAHAATATLRPRPGLDPRGKAAEARPSRGRGGVC